MNKRALLVYLAPESDDFFGIRPTKELKTTPKLGLQYLCAVLEEKGIKTELLDQSYVSFSMEELVLRLKKTPWLFVGFYSAYSVGGKVVRSIQEIKKELKDLPIIVGGPGCFCPDEYLSGGCDFVCHGEGERTIADLADYFEGKRSKGDLKGVSYFEHGGIKHAPPQDLIQDLDTLPFPKRDKEQVEKSFNFQWFDSARPFINMVASRGCPFSCAYCASCNFWGNRYRSRSVANVMREIEECKKLYQIKFISFHDDVFGLNREWLRSFCEKMIAGKHDIRWACMMHFTSLEDPGILELMGNAGCVGLVLGVQSVSARALRMSQRTPVSPVLLNEIVRKAKQANIMVKLQFILGLPGEEQDTDEQNLALAIKARSHYVFFYKFLMLEGSSFFKEFYGKEEMLLKWEKTRGWALLLHLRFYLHPVIFFQNLLFLGRRLPQAVRIFFSVLLYLGRTFLFVLGPKRHHGCDLIDDRKNPS